MVKMDKILLELNKLVVDIKELNTVIQDMVIRQEKQTEAIEQLARTVTELRWR